MLADHVPTPKSIMALALLELTVTAAGDVLEQLLVITAAQATEHQYPALGAAVNRVRLFARIDSTLSGVPSSVRIQLDRAALASWARLGRRHHNDRRNSRPPMMALWHAGRMHELHSQSLTESLDVLLRQAGHNDNCVLVELSDPTPAAAATTGSILERFYTRLYENMNDRRPTGYPAVRGAHPTPAAADEATPACTSPLTPVQQIFRDAAAQREALAAQWPSAAQASAQLGSHVAKGSYLASQLRCAGKLLGVYVRYPEPSYRYPTWQFGPNCQPVDHLTEILRVLRDYGPFEHELYDPNRTTGWGEVEWFLSPNVLLDGATPAEVLATDPAGVLQAARTEFASGT